MAGLKPHVLRYWETQFKELSPTKNRAGNRVYRAREIKLIELVKHLLYEENGSSRSCVRRDSWKKSPVGRSTARRSGDCRKVCNDSLRFSRNVLKIE